MAAVDASAVARVTGIETQFRSFRTGVQFLPQQIAVIGQGATATTYSTDRRQVFSAAEVGRRYGFGSPLHLAVRELIPAIGTDVGSVPVYVLPLEDDSEGAAATGDITPDSASLPVSNADSYRVRVGGYYSERFVIGTDDDAASIVTAMADAINAVSHMPVSATADTEAADPVVNLEALWAGESGNDITLSIEPDADGDAEFTITEMSGGLVNPTVDSALAKIGDSLWITQIVNCLNPDDETALDAFEAWGDARWDPLTRKPVAGVYRGSYEATVNSATAITSTRQTDRVNVQITVPGSPDMPLKIAAAAVNPIARLANNNPPHDYGSQPLPTISAGDDQWTYSERDSAVKGGAATTELKSGQVTLSDVVNSYAPEGEEPPAYRFVVDIVKLQQAVYNLDLIFNTPKWDGAPLIPSDQATTNPDAKKPSDAKAATAGMVDSLASEAIISDPGYSKANILAEIDSQNPKRLNVRVPVQLAGNTNIKAINLDFGFYFGG